MRQNTLESKFSGSPLRSFVSPESHLRVLFRTLVSAFLFEFDFEASFSTFYSNATLELRFRIFIRIRPRSFISKLSFLFEFIARFPNFYSNKIKSFISEFLKEFEFSLLIQIRLRK